MEITTVAVLGGSGFIGRHVCHALASRGLRVRVATRDRERAKEQLIPLPTASVEVADIHDPRSLAAFFRDADAVVNLVGVLHDGRGHASFRSAHVELARSVVAACREAGIRRLLHMSALAAAPDAPSAYLRSKGEAEAIVAGSGLDWTVFRPSVVFGRDDSFLNLFAEALRIAPLMFLACPDAKFQPVFVEDVAEVFARSLGDLSSHGCRYDLCGPKVYTLRELVEYVGAVTGRPRPVIGLNDTLSYCQAAAMEWLPVKIMTRDNVRSMQVPSVCDCELPFGVVPAALEAVAPGWLGSRTPRARYYAFRERASRNESVTRDW